MALKKRTVVSPAAGAVSLPSLMADLPGTRRLEEVPLDKLSPAPADWNFYAPLPDDKLLELIESIRANDLLHPIVVWKQPDGALMILSGHNRVRAYTALLEKTGEDKYRRIPATVLTDITADDAHEIVVDSNYVQRVLTPSEKARSISQKYALAGRKKRSRNGVRKSKYEQIGEEYNLSARQIARYVRLGSLDGSLLKLLDGGKLPLTTALRLVDFSAENQKYLAAHHADELAGPKMARLTAAMTPEQKDAALQAEPQTVRVSVTVPAALEEDFRRMAEEWLHTHR